MYFNLPLKNSFIVLGLYFLGCHNGSVRFVLLYPFQSYVKEESKHFVEGISFGKQELIFPIFRAYAMGQIKDETIKSRISSFHFSTLVIDHSFHLIVGERFLNWICSLLQQTLRAQSTGWWQTKQLLHSWWWRRGGMWAKVVSQMCLVKPHIIKRKWAAKGIPRMLSLSRHDSQFFVFDLK